MVVVLVAEPFYSIFKRTKFYVKLQLEARLREFRGRSITAEGKVLFLDDFILDFGGRPNPKLNNIKNNFFFGIGRDTPQVRYDYDWLALYLFLNVYQGDYDRSKGK